mmetsp:Transcript_65079/g.173506  ORF Transcript_65079/g.173506 Transcript_65079/m.173506 type:complete len:257 (+) Transcript_65079:357-1127(+)
MEALKPDALQAETFLSESLKNLSSMMPAAACSAAASPFLWPPFLKTSTASSASLSASSSFSMNIWAFIIESRMMPSISTSLAFWQTPRASFPTFINSSQAPNWKCVFMTRNMPSASPLLSPAWRYIFTISWAAFRASSPSRDLMCASCSSSRAFCAPFRSSKSRYRSLAIMHTSFALSNSLMLLLMSARAHSMSAWPRLSFACLKSSATSLAAFMASSWKRRASTLLSSSTCFCVFVTFAIIRVCPGWPTSAAFER